MSKNNKNSDFIDIKGTITDYAKHWYWFVISIVICCIGAYVVSKKFPQKNAIQSSILVVQDDGTASMLNGLGGLLGADPYVQDEIFVIKSHTLLKSVAKDLGVNKTHVVKTGLLSSSLEYPTFPVDVTAPESLIDTLKTALNFKIKVAKGGKTADVVVKARKKKIADVDDVTLPATIKTIYGDFVVETTDTYNPEEKLTTWVTVNGYDGAAENLSTDILAEIASKKSNVIEMSITSTNAEYGCDILNKSMAEYNRLGIEERNQRALKTAQFIQERLNLISSDLDEAETRIENFKEGNRFVDVGSEAAINTRLKTEYESKLVELQTQQEILKMTLSFLSSPENKYELMPVIDLGMGGEKESIVDNYNEMVLKRMTLMTSAKPNNRSILELEKQIDAMRENILVAIDRLLKSNEVAVKEARYQANAAISKLGNVPMQEREFISLKRQQQVKQQLFLFLLQRSEETAMLIANAIPKGTIIDPAYVLTEPVGLSKMVLLLIAIVIGIFIPIFVLYIMGLLRSKITGRSDVERNTDLPILGEMCIDHSGNHIVVSESSTTPASELFRMIRTNLQFILGNPEDKVVMVTSSMSGEGKSFISCNLAASLAMLHKKVVLVGTDIRKPQLANYLGVPQSPGLTQYLSNKTVTAKDIIQPYDAVPGMSVVVAGPIPPNPGELMTSPRLSEIINTLREEFDYIILDSAPVGMVSDSFNLSKNVDATIYVVRSKITRLQDIRFMNDVAEDNRLKRINIIVNGTLTKKGYGYGYK